MARPNGAMGSPYSGMADQLKKSSAFDTVGTEQNIVDLSKKEEPSKTVVEAVVEPSPTPTEEFTSNEISKLVSALAKIANIKGASGQEITIEIGGLEVKVTK